jgi:hypothetical protein
VGVDSQSEAFEWPKAVRAEAAKLGDGGRPHCGMKNAALWRSSHPSLNVRLNNALVIVFPIPASFMMQFVAVCSRNSVKCIESIKCNVRLQYPFRIRDANRAEVVVSSLHGRR